MNENIIFSQLEKVKDPSTIEPDDNANYNRLPDGYVTDGFGNVYILPNDGTTPIYSLDSNYGYRYNWKEKVIELYAKEDNEYQYVTEYYINPYDFIDNPEYWNHRAVEELKDELDYFVGESVEDCEDDYYDYDEEDYNEDYDDYSDYDDDLIDDYDFGII